MGCAGSKAIRIKPTPADTTISVKRKAPASEGKNGKEFPVIAESHNETADENGPMTVEGDAGNLVKEQITSVQETWTLVKEAQDLEHVGVDFYLRLFTDSPELLPLFSFRDIDLSNETARSDKRLTRQALATMQHVDLAVSSLNDLGSIVPALKDLGARHVMYNVKDHHYESVGAALLETLQNGLGERFTTEVREAWTKVYGIVANTMKAGAREVLDAQ
ncbi:neuroglobin-like [Montipora foliosa]|uniref:neuroglobin-like n=1 Tax=Montipora foliosa TaxID=591990 RepID=UPI0035F1A8B2